jgi:hypothetical protein
MISFPLWGAGGLFSFPVSCFKLFDLEFRNCNLPAKSTTGRLRFLSPFGGQGDCSVFWFLDSSFLIWSLEIVTYLPKAQQEGYDFFPPLGGRGTAQVSGF